MPLEKIKANDQNHCRMFHHMTTPSQSPPLLARPGAATVPATLAGSGDGAVLGATNTTWLPSQRTAVAAGCFLETAAALQRPGGFRKGAAAP